MTLEELLGRLDDVAYMLETEAEHIWSINFWPHQVETQDRADLFRASLGMNEAQSVLEEVRDRLRERQY